MDVLPLPACPNLEHYRKFAKGLVKSAAHPTLSAAQFAIARSHGFQSWPKFARHIQALALNSPVSRFEAAADAIVNGELRGIDRDLVRARSTREHRATLLHYVSANGVEDYRQKTPPNIVPIAELLLHAGAEVDAEANVYGGCATLELVATSVHPARAGVQLELLQKLLDYGASLEKPSLLTACLGNGRLPAAEFLAGRGARIDLAAAAGLGRLEAVQSLLDPASADQSRDAFLYASAYGRDAVVELLLENGADLAAHRADGQTALHWAVIGGHPATVALLLHRHPPLEIENGYGGTAFGQALWSAAHGGDTEVYLAILEALAKAGARIPGRHVPVNPRIDAWLADHGSRAEPASHWYGESTPPALPSA
jgi:hypothetical protein